MNKSVYVKTLGCKVNTADSVALENQFIEKGYRLVKHASQADVAVINSCTVTETAEKESRYLARRYKRENPEAKIIVTGCYAQNNSAKLSELTEIDYIIPNEVKTDLVPMVHRYVVEGKGPSIKTKLPGDVKPVKENRQTHFKSSLTLFDKTDSSQTRVFMKVQDGCNGFCTYCQIPYARGASISVDSSKVMDEVKRLIAAKTGEIVLTGIHIGDYGLDFTGQRKMSFYDLLRRMTDLKGLPRIRISSLEPAELTLDMVKLMAERRDIFCDHFHFPLQSGSDRILKLMRRTYDTQRYFESVEMVREYLPGCNIGCDIIPGFPSETDQDFHTTLEFIKKCDLNYLHVFPYSKRPNTAAMRMPGHLDHSIIKQRAKSLRDLSSNLQKDYHERQIGKELDVLWETGVDDQNRPIGLSSNYLRVSPPLGQNQVAGTLSRVKIKGFLAKDRLLGLVNPS